MNTRQQTVAKNRMPQQVGGQPIQNGIIEENSLPKVKHVLCNGIRIKIAFNGFCHAIIVTKHLFYRIKSLVQ